VHGVWVDVSPKAGNSDRLRIAGGCVRLRYLDDYLLYFAIFLLIGKSPLSRFGIPISIPFSGMALFFVLMMIALFSRPPKLIKGRFLPLFALFSVICFIMIFSICYARNLEYAFYNYSLPSIMIYLGTTLVYFTIEVNKDLPRLFNYCFAVSCVMLFLGFASVLRGGSVERLSVLGGGPNTYYRFMIQGYILAMYRRTRTNSIWDLAIAIAFVLFSLATGSKGALAVLLVVMGVQIVQNLRVSKAMLKKTIFPALSLISLVLFWPSLVGFLSRFFPKVYRAWTVLRYNELVSSTSGAARINMIKTAARLIVERPLFGWGPAGFSEGALRYGVDHPYVHNVVVELFVEYGLFVGALFGIFLLLTCYRAVSVFKYLKQKENERGLETLLNSSVLLFLNYFVASLFSGNVVDARAVFVFALTTELIVQRVKERTECGLCSET